MFAAVRTKAAFPVSVSVKLPVAFPPTATLPKLTLVGLSDSAGCVPFPAREATVGELCALLLMEMLPTALPGAVGANCALRVLDCPGTRENGKTNPLMPKPVPVMLPCVMFKLAVPEFVKVMLWVLAAPTVTFPKLTLLGVIESWCFTPLPLRATLVGELEALLSSDTVPVAVPVTVGANCRIKLLDCPAESVRGNVGPVTVKPAPLTAA